MNRIESLIAEYCPKGVEYQELGNQKYFTLIMGQSPNGNSVTPDSKGTEFHQGKSFFSNFVITHSNLYTDHPLKICEPKSVLMSVRAPVGSVNLTERRICLGRGLCAISVTDEINYLFLYYLMQIYGKRLGEKSTGSTFDSTTFNVIKKIKIPVPPLPIQQEIVNILDKFTQLEAELEAELEARRIQYDYLRNQLLRTKENLLLNGVYIEWKPLGEVSSINRGTAITQKETTEGVIPVIANAAEPVYFHNKSNRSGETIVIARSGAYAGLVSYWNIPFFLTDAFSVHPNNSFLNTKFLYFYLKNSQEVIHSMKKGSGVPHVRANDFLNYSIPVPPLYEQERIVRILDKFDTLVNDISIGLPAEINARKKQYEYYRNKLLTFKELEA